MPALKRACCFLAVVAAVLCVNPRAAAAQAASARLEARVVDDASGEPIEGAHLVVAGTKLGAYSDADGIARIPRIPTGLHQLSVTMLGYEPAGVDVDFAAGAQVQTELRLRRAPIPVKPLDVTGQARDPALVASGFYDRQRLGGGTFITGERLAAVARRSNRITDALQAVPGIRVAQNPRGTGLVVLTTRQTNAGRCYPQLYVDGLNTHYFDPPEASRAMKLRHDNADVNAMIPLADVLAIEVHPGAPLPLEYDQNPCGVILVWTKRGP